MPANAPSKITYTATTADMTAFHAAFDAALASARAAKDRSYPMFVDGAPIMGKSRYEKKSPIDGTVLSEFPLATVAEVDAALKAAKKASKAWAAKPWPERVALLRKAAVLIRERKYDIAAVVALEVGKNRMESMGDTEEAADLLDYYAKQLEDADGYVKPLGKLLPNERTASVMRPYGVFVCVAPFNFPISLSAGMSGAALLGGNVVVYKPSLECPLTGYKLYECFRDAGVPAGAFQLVTGDGPAVGEALWRHPLTDGVVFTGSKEVGLKIHKEFSARYVKPVLMELGGKNPTYVSESADLDQASDGVMKSAFGLQGQKCSACSRVYVHEKVYDAFVKRLVEKTAKLVVGDPTDKAVYMGPVIHERAVKTYLGAVESAKKGGRILYGGERLKGDGLRQGTLRRAGHRRAAAGPRAVHARAVLPLPRGGQGQVLRRGRRRMQQGRIRPDRGHLHGEQGRDRAVLRRGGVRRVLRQPPHRRDDGRLARRADLLWLERLRLLGQRRLRPLLRVAVHARAEPDGHGIT